MDNQSIVAIPPDLEDPIVLRRFLARLVEQIDVVLGNKSDPSKDRVDQEQLAKASKQLSELLKRAEATLERTVELTKEITEKDINELTDKVASNNLRNNQQDDRLDSIESLNGQQNIRLNDIENAGYITEAPIDGSKYVRRNGAWEVL